MKPMCEMCGEEAEEHGSVGDHALCDPCEDAFRVFLNGIFENREALAMIKQAYLVGAAEEWLVAHPEQTTLSAERIVAMAERTATTANER